MPLSQGPQRTNREQRVHVSGPQENHTNDRLHRCNRKCPKICIVRDDHAVLGVCRLQENGILGTDQRTFSHVEYIAAPPA